MAQQVGPGQGSADGSVRSRDREERSRDVGLPVSTLREALPHLRRPFTPEAIRFKVQNVLGQNAGAVIVAYIDARLVVERLNLVVPDLWHATYDHVDGTKLMWCHLTIDGMTRSDVGESPKGFSKDLISDSLKRAAVHFGVGVSVYALPQVTIWMNDARGRLELRGSKKQPALTEQGHTWLREGYAGWLERDGRDRFDTELDHGDVEGATFDDSEPEVDEFAPDAAPALEDDGAQQLTKEAREAYEHVDHKEIPPAKFNAWLTGAAHSHVELQRLVDYLRERAS